MNGDRADFFISYAGSDRPWAEWVGWQLEQAGYRIELDIWDWRAGQNFIAAMDKALRRCDRVVALLSASYFESSRYTEQEWTALLVKDDAQPAGRLLPLLVEEVAPSEVPPLLRALVSARLFGLEEAQAQRVLLDAVAGPRHPDRQPGFPGTAMQAEPDKPGPRLPGREPGVWSAPPRNPAFTGRDGLLVAVRERLLAEDSAVVQALHGMGGVGKTQLALEYSHRFAGGYDVVWWIAAEVPGLIGAQLADLAAELGQEPAGTGTEEVGRAVRAGLRTHGRWLLVFDNAENAGDLAAWLPGRGGHVLITSRAPGWTGLAVPVEIDVLARGESVALLQAGVKELTTADAGALAEELGDLPLAIAQAAAYLADTGMAAAEYRALLRTRAADLLGLRSPVGYPRPLAAATQMSIDRLGGEDTAAAELVDVCAFLGPEPISGEMFTRASEVLPASLARAVTDPMARGELLARIGRYGIARVDQSGLQFHRLTQAIARDRLDPDGAAVHRVLAGKILASNRPGDPGDPVTWPAWASLMPHLLAVDFAVPASPALRTVACEATRYLLVRGSIRSSHDLAERLYRHWEEQFGSDDAYALRAVGNLAAALWHMRRYPAARDLDEVSLERRRLVLGDDHPDTLSSANSLASDLFALGETEAARDLFRDTYDRRRRVLGDDHPDTLISANNLAALNDPPAARSLLRDTLERRRRVLGHDHPDTMKSASNLAIVLRYLGEWLAARDLDRDTLRRRRQVLGYDHPDTLSSASNLASALYELGEVEAARDLDQDTMERRSRVLGEDHPDTLSSASNLASDLRKLGEIEAARTLTGQTLEQQRLVLGENHPDTRQSARLLAQDTQTLDEWISGSTG